MDTEVVEGRPERQQRSTTQESRSKSDLDGACFDCNICLDFAVDPVVTLCGHLYCWPCIYKWLRLESTNPQHCPVCKAALSSNALVPLYGRGYSSRVKAAAPGVDDIPRRPSTTLAASVSGPEAPPVHQHRHFNHHHRRQHGDYMLSSSTTTRLLPPTTLGGTAIAVLPWVLGDERMGSSYSDSRNVIGSNNSPRLRRQEMQAKRSLHRISIFLFCCVVLCLLVF